MVLKTLVDKIENRTKSEWDRLSLEGIYELNLGCNGFGGMSGESNFIQLLFRVSRPRQKSMLDTPDIELSVRKPK